MDYYELLGVDRDASEAEIEAAFREAAKETHPDVSDDPNAQEKFTAITRARDVLTDSADRRQYDRLGHVEYVERIESRSADRDWESETRSDSGTADGDDTSAHRETTATNEEPRSDAATETDRESTAETAATESATDASVGESSPGTTTGESTAETATGDSATDTAAGGSATGTATTGTDAGETTTGTTDGEAATTAAPGGTTAQSQSETETEAETNATAEPEKTAKTTTDAEPSQHDESTAAGGEAVDRGAAVDEWRKRHGSDSYPDGPFDDPLANAAARAWLGRLGGTAVLAAVLLAVLSAPSIVGTDALPSAAVDALDRLRLLLVRPDFGPLAAVALVATGAVGHELWNRGTVPTRTRHAVRPPNRVLLVAAGAAMLCPVGWAATLGLGGEPTAIATAALPIVAVVSVVAVAVGSLATSVERALLVSLPLGVAAGGVALSGITPPIPVGGSIGTQPTIAVGAGLLAIWSLSVGAPLAAGRTSQYVWNLRYRGGVGLTVALWELAMVVPLVVLAWTVVVSAPAVALPSGAEIARLDLLPVATAAPIVVAGAAAARGRLGSVVSNAR